MSTAFRKKNTARLKDNQNDGSPEKKRKLDVSNETDIIGKSQQKQKDVPHSVADFSATDFVSKLKNPSTAFSALERFILLAEDYNAASSTDVVKEMCQVTDGVFEILTVLEAGKRKSTEYHTIFRVLSVVLLRIADDLLEFVSVGERLVKRLLTNSSSSLYHQLAMRNKAAHIKSCLRLLTAMVMISPVCACDLFLQLDFSTSHADLYALFSRRDLKDPEDVRQCVLLFVMSFLIAGDDGLVIQIVEQKFLLQAVFKDMHMDKLVAIESALPTILNKVVKNPLVNKTLKVKLFNEVSLQHLCRLFSWKGPKKWNASSKSSMDLVVNELDAVVSSDVSAVYDLLMTFLTDLCTVQKTGILFFDKSCGTSPRNVNPLISSVLKNVQGHLSMASVQALVLQLLQASPDQLTRFLSHLKSSLTPRLSEKWLSMVGFLCQVYEKVFSWSSLTKLTPLVNIEKMLLIVSNMIIPPMLDELITGLKSEHIAVRHGVLAVLKVVLTNAGTIVNSIDSWTPDNCPYTTIEKIDFKNSFLDLMAKKLPSMPMIMTVWQKVSKGLDEKSVKEKQTGEFSGVVDELDHLLRIEEVLICLLEVVPVTSDNIDVANLLDTIRQQGNKPNNKDNMDKISLLQINLLQILTKMNLKNLLWTKLTGDGDTVCHLLLEMLTINRCDNESLTLQTQLLITQMIVGTGFFGETSSEIPTWLNRILSREEGNRQDAVDCFSLILSTFFTNPYPHIDKMDSVSAVREKTIQNRKQVEKTGLSVDEILEMDVDIEQLLETSESDYSSITLTDFELKSNREKGQRFAFSPLVIVALETLNSKKGYVEYVCEVLMDVLHSQKDPIPLCTLIQTHSTVLQEAALYPYLISWIPKPKKKRADLDLDGSGNSKLCYQLIKLSYNFSKLSKDVSLIKQIKELLKEVREYDSVSYIEQLLLYIRTSVNCQDKDLKGQKAKLSLYFTLLQIILSRVLDFDSIDNSVTGAKNKDLSVSTIVQTVWELFLGDCTLQKYFLGAYSKEANLNEDQKTVSNLITVHMANLIRALSLQETSRTFPKLDTLFQIYVTKSCNVVQISISELHKSKKDLAQFLPDSLHTALGGFLPYYSLASLVNLANSLLKISPKALNQVTIVTYKELLEDVLQRICKDGSSRRWLSGDSIAQLFCLVILPQFNKESFHKTCLMLIKLWPDYCLNAGEDLVTGLLSSSSDVQTKLLSILTSQNPVLGNQLFTRIQESGQKKNLDVYLDLCLPLATSFKAEGDNKRLSVIIENVWADLFNWLMNSNQYKFTDVRSDLWFTILPYSGEIRLKSVAESLIEKLRDQTVDVTILHLQTLKISTDLLTETCDLRAALLSSYLDRLIISLRKKDRSANIQDALFTQLHQLLQDISTDDLDRPYLVEVWPSFVKYVLKVSYTKGEALCVLEKLIPMVYSSDSEDSPSPTFAVLYQMITSHSKFIPVMFEEEATEAKVDLVRLMMRIVELCPECCEKSHVAVILGAYQATLSITDQILLKLLFLYENNGTGLASQRDYLWGSKARDYYTSVTKGKSLLTQLSTSQIIEMFDEDKLRTSTYNFPLRRTLIPAGIVESKALQSKDECYDPCFVLPLITHLLGPESLLDCYQFVKFGCLGYVFAALSVHDEVMRSSAYLALKLFYQHMEGAKFMGKDQVFYLVDTMRNSITSPNTKLASVVTHFIAKALTSIGKPESHMFQLVNAFLLLKPEMDMVNVPEFYKFFNSSSFEYKQERGWMLELLETGLRERRDYRMFEKRFIFKLLLSFYYSPLSDNWCKSQILKILLAACHEKSVTFDLIMHHGILGWISGIVESSCKHAERSGLIMEIVIQLWKTVKQSTHYLPILPQLKLLLNYIIQHFSEVITIEKEAECLQTLCDVVESSFGEALSTNCDVLQVFQLFSHYYTVTKDEQRKNQIQTAIELAGYKHISYTKTKQRSFSIDRNTGKSVSVGQTNSLNTSITNQCTKPENPKISQNSHAPFVNPDMLVDNLETELLNSIQRLVLTWLPTQYGNITGDFLQSITVIFTTVSETLLLQINTSSQVNQDLTNILQWLEKWLCTNSTLSVHLCNVILDSAENNIDSIVTLLMRIYPKLTQLTTQLVKDSLETRETGLKNSEVNYKEILMLLNKICLSLVGSLSKKSKCKKADLQRVQQHIKAGSHLLAGFHLRKLMWSLVHRQT